jgi:hypothetical protein
MPGKCRASFFEGDRWASAPENKAAGINESQPGSRSHRADCGVLRQERKMERWMDPVLVLKALERERELLKNFIGLSEEQLLLLKDEKTDAVNSLLIKRADLMIELRAIEVTLGTWISQIRTDPAVSSAMMRELRAVNHEIVNMANHIVEIDVETHERLDALTKPYQ